MYWAHRISADFPDGQMYANLGAFDPAGPVAPAEVLAQFLRAPSVCPPRSRRHSQRKGRHCSAR